MISDEQKQLIDAVEAVHLACQLSSKEHLNINVTFHHQACNNTPGWNIFMNNARFELGYQYSKVRFSLPPDEDECQEFTVFLTEKLGFANYTSKYKTGIKYIFELDLDELIYTEDGIDKISKLTNRILQYV
jgi:hypothetical protein